MFYSLFMITLVHGRWPLCPVVHLCFYPNDHGELTLWWQKNFLNKPCAVCLYFSHCPDHKPQLNSATITLWLLPFKIKLPLMQINVVQLCCCLSMTAIAIQKADESARIFILPLLAWYWCRTPRQEYYFNYPNTQTGPGLCFYLKAHLPHCSLYARHLSVVSEMAENDSAEPPAPLHPAWAGGQDTPISDPHRAAVPG